MRKTSFEAERALTRDPLYSVLMHVLRRYYIKLLALFQNPPHIKGIYCDKERDDPNKIDMINDADAVFQRRQPYSRHICARRMRHTRGKRLDWPGVSLSRPTTNIIVLAFLASRTDSPANAPQPPLGISTARAVKRILQK
jgi:hypothetical protein